MLGSATAKLDRDTGSQYAVPLQRVVLSSVVARREHCKLGVQLLHGVADDPRKK
jgi:hypothetical protein